MRIVEQNHVALERDHDVARMYTLSPYVWREGENYHLLLRCVPHEKNPALKISAIYYGRGATGTHFKMEAKPVLRPDTEMDSGGCEDPTVCRFNNRYYVFYSGWNEEERDGNLLLATGTSLTALKKHGKVLPPNAHFDKCREATPARQADGTWLMFFEYSHNERSCIGLASAPSLDGPWEYRPAPFDARPEYWDSWHLSTGPIVNDRKTRVMFYNGSDKEGNWRIGWVRFDSQFSGVVERCDRPLFVPPHMPGGFRDVAFAASAVRGGDMSELYYSVADAFVYRALVQHPSALPAKQWTSEGIVTANRSA